MKKQDGGFIANNRNAIAVFISTPNLYKLLNKIS